MLAQAQYHTQDRLIYLCFPPPSMATRYGSAPLAPHIHATRHTPLLAFDETYLLAPHRNCQPCRWLEAPSKTEPAGLLPTYLPR